MVKGLSLGFQQYFGPFTMWLVEGSSETVLFRHLSNQVFPSLQVQNKKTRDAHFFKFKKYKIESKFRKFKNIIKKIFFISGIAAFEIVAINWLC